MRVVITGIGAVSAFGAGAALLIEKALAGERGIRDVSLFALEGARSTIAAEVPALELSSVFSASEIEGSSRTDAMACVAAREALAQASASPKRLPIDLVLGGSTAGMFETEELLAKLDGDLDDAAGARLRTHPLSSTVDKMQVVVGPFRRTRTVCCACTSGAAAIALGAVWIRTGRASIVLAGGADALCRLTYSGFGALSVLDRAPARPFDKSRAGLTIGEGAAFLVLESEASAKARGARIIGEVAGVALGSEAHHITNPEPGGKTAATIMRRAIEDAGLSPRDVQYVNAHGTGTPQNDANEASAIRQCFGDVRVPVSSSKAQIGHTLGASGAIEAAIVALALERQALPPTAGLTEPDPACDIDHVMTAARPLQGFDVALSNSFGFGGTGATLVLTRPLSASASREPSALPIALTGVAAILPRGLVSGLDLADLLRPTSARPEAPLSDPTAGLDAAASRRMDRAARLSTAVIERALLEADEGARQPIDRGGVASLSGTAFGSVDGSVRFMKRVLTRGASMASPADFPNLVPSSPVSHASIYLHLGGPAIATPDLSATAESAFATAVELVEAGVAASAVAGSVEEVSKLTERVLAPLLGIRSMSAAGDGASAIVVETAAAARARGARIMATLRAFLPYRREGGELAVALLDGEGIVPTPRSAVVSERAVDPSRVLRASRWREATHLTLDASAGDHVGCGGVALAAAIALLARGDADRVVFVGEAPDRGYLFVLEREDAP